MIPKIDFQIHEVLVRAFFVVGTDRVELDARFNKFIDEFSQKEEKILSLIEKYSGFKWTKNSIPVFLVPDSRLILSFVQENLVQDLPGIVQKVRSDNKFINTFLFIHELAHVNQYQSNFFDDKYKTVSKVIPGKHLDVVELSADIVTLYVLRELFGENSEYEKEFIAFLENTSDRNKKKFEELQKYLRLWDLHSKPLEYYLAL